MKILTSDHKVLTDKQINKIFQNIGEIKDTAKTMWKRLEEACKHWPEQTPKVGAIFLAMVRTEIQTQKSFPSPLALADMMFRNSDSRNKRILYAIL